MLFCGGMAACFQPFLIKFEIYFAELTTDLDEIGPIQLGELLQVKHAAKMQKKV